jgi:hypothetical protein
LAVTGLPSAATGWLPQLGITGAAFAGALGGVLLTLALARGVQQTLRLLLAGVIVGVVLGALSSLLLMRLPEVMRTLQGFMLGSTGFLGWSAVQVLALSLVPALIVALALARALDALALGEATALSLGVPLGPARGLLVAVMALATGAGALIVSDGTNYLTMRGGGGGGGGGGVTSVTGTAGRISSTGGATPVLDLISTGVTPGAYAAPTITVDNFGRITAIVAGAAFVVSFVLGINPEVQVSVGATGFVANAWVLTNYV